MVALVTTSLVVTSLITGADRTGASEQDVPAQFVAKVYTEGLGRLPDQREWQAAVDTFSSGGCTIQSLAEYGQQVYTSADYAGLGYDNTSRLLTLFRGVLNTEPDPGRFARLKRELDHGGSWATVVAKFFAGRDFAALVPKICSGSADSSQTSYAVAGQPPAPLPTVTAGFSGTGAQLQQVLDSTPSGGTVQIAQRAVVEVTEPLRVPHGVTLTTTDAPDTEHYAVMGRLVRGGDFDAPMVDVRSGATLTGVWIDGARNSPGNSSADRDSIRVPGGRNTKVVGNKISNTAGDASVNILGMSNGYRCSDITVAQNVITAYSNDHYLTRRLDGQTSGTWSDGISDSCGDTTITRNQIVDTGGIGIATYRATIDPSKKVSQQTSITKNKILSAGIPMYGAIVADPYFYLPGDDRGARRYDFSGTRIAQNTLWTAPSTHFVIGISAGTRAWYSGGALTGANTGHGVTITGNTTGDAGARVRTGIAISGMEQVRLGPNRARWVHENVPGKPGNPCPSVDVAVSESAGTADVRTKQNYTDVAFDGCMGEP